MTRKRVIRKSPRAARRVTCAFGAAGSSTSRSRLRRFSTKSEEDPQPDQRDREGDEEDGVVLARELGEQDEAASGPSIAPTVSSARCTPNERPRPARSLSSEISASRGAVRMPLPRRSTSSTAVVPSHAPPTATRPSLHSADAAVAGGGDLFVALLAVGQQAAEQAHERRGALVHAVDEAELQRAEADLVGQVQRQDRRDHLLREIGEEADEAEEDDGPRDGDPAPAGPRGRARVVISPAVSSPPGVAMTSAGTLRTEVYTLV